MHDRPRHDPAQVRRPLVAAATVLAVLALATALSGRGDGGGPPVADEVRLTSVGTVVRPGTEPEPVVGPAAASPTPVDNPADPARPSADQSVSPGSPPGSSGRARADGTGATLSATSRVEPAVHVTAAPGPVTVTQTGTTATLTWPAGGPVTYEVSVEVLRSGQRIGLSTYPTGPRGSLALQGISPSLQYRATVRAKGEDGLLSPPSTPVHLNEASPEQLPGAVDPAAAGTRLTLTYAARAGAAPRTWTLTCDPVGGDHPAADRGCGVLAREGTRLFGAPPSPPQACAMAVYGEETATLAGTWRGQQVTHRFARNNSCAEQEWAATVGLLPARAGVAGG